MKRLLLLGGGHAHVQVVKAFGKSPPDATAIALINRGRFTPYSGMLPGLIAGHYSHAESHIDLARLCARCGVEFIEQEACALDLRRRRVLATTGAEHGYDLLSADTGSTPPLDAVPGAQEHAIAVKPIEAFLSAIERLIAGLGRPAKHAIAIVGAGAAGFEVALALDYRLRRHGGDGVRPRLRLVSDAACVLPGFPARVRRHAERILREQAIAIHTNARVAQVDAEGLLMADGDRIDASQAVFVTGAAPSPMFAQAGLQTDERGFIAVDAGLRSLSHADVFASGDVAAVIQHPRPKAGVFAVRQGPPLIRNLRRALAGEPPLPFVPQRRYLVLLSTGRKHAIASRGSWTLQGEWVWRWKDWIDRRFVTDHNPR